MIDLQKERETLLNELLVLRRENAALRSANQAGTSDDGVAQRFEAILAAVPDIIMEVDSKKVYTWANMAGKRFFGDDVIGKEAASYFEGVQETYETVTPLFEGCEEVIYVESRQRRKDGEVRLLAWWCRVLKAPDGEVIGALSTARDITDARLAEEEVHRLNAELEERVADRTNELAAANRELEGFAYSVSHDLRAPLRAIDGFTRILEEEHSARLDDEGRRLCGIVRENTANMDRLINAILALSRTGRIEMNCSEVDMTTLARSIFYEEATFEERTRVDFHVDDLPPATADPTLIRQVWSNLLGNALKFSSKREVPVIRVSFERGDRETVYRVTDNGAGFDMRYIDKLFGVFQRLHGVREFKGTGVGLAIVQRVVQRHGGRVWGVGAPGEGASFFFSLPDSRGSIE